jgi:hypothetical protein
LDQAITKSACASFIDRSMAARNYAKIIQKCPDVRDLEKRIGRWLFTGAQR